MSKLLESLALLALPLAAFQIGRWILARIGGLKKAMQPLAETVAPADRKPLNQRLRYDRDDVDRYWGALQAAAALSSEERALKADLAFPFLYGTALVVSLSAAWAALGRPFPVFWLLAPVAVAAVADWTENFVQLGQLRRYRSGGKEALQDRRIAIASKATFTKLLFFIGSWLLLADLLFCFLRQAV